MEIRNWHFKILCINFPQNSGNKVEDCPCYAGLDEQLFYNAKYEMIPDSYTGKLLSNFGIFLNSSNFQQVFFSNGK